MKEINKFGKGVTSLTGASAGIVLVQLNADDYILGINRLSRGPYNAE